MVEEEGLEARWARHEPQSPRRMTQGLEAIGLSLLPPAGRALWTLNAVRGARRRRRSGGPQAAADDYNIEIGAGLGPLAGKIWRVGLMGSGSTPQNLARFLTALRVALNRKASRPRYNSLMRLLRSGSRDLYSAIGFGYACLRVSDACRTCASARRPIPPPPRSWTCARARRRRRATASSRSRWVPYRRISPNLKRAVLVAEDNAFWTHDGVDLEQLRESIEVNLERGEFARGASTITQQLAKNLYLSPSRNPSGSSRADHRAAPRGRALKARIFELYLNVIEWGDGIWGAEAASRTYFHKPAVGVDRRRGGAARRRDQQPAQLRSRASVSPAEAAPADDHAAHGGGHAAARHCRSRLSLPVDAPLLDTIPALPPAAAPDVATGHGRAAGKGPRKAQRRLTFQPS